MVSISQKHEALHRSLQIGKSKPQSEVGDFEWVEAEGVSKNEQRHWNKSQGRLTSRY